MTSVFKTNLIPIPKIKHDCSFRFSNQLSELRKSNVLEWTVNKNRDCIFVPVYLYSLSMN